MSDKALMSDGPLRAFNSGWALVPFHGSKAHYWNKVETDVAFIGRHGRLSLWRSLCHVEAVTNEKAGPLGEGNWARCKRCERKETK